MQKGKQQTKTKKPAKPQEKRTAKKPAKKAIKKPSEQTVKLKNKDIEVEIKIVAVPIKTHKDNKGGHYHVIVDNIDDNHVSVGLSTRKKKGKNHPNYPLEKSPFDDGKNSNMRRQGTVDSVKNYHSPRTGTMTEKDFNQAKVYGERAKQKYINEKENKKK